MFRGRSFDEGSLALGEVLEKKNEILNLLRNNSNWKR